MFPNLHQRLIILAGLVVGGLCWYAVAGLLAPADGSDGISLFSARIGLPGAVALAAAAGLPALLLGVAGASTGNPLSGVFTGSGALLVLACAGGPIEGWMRRSPLPQAYGKLIAETALWFAGLVVLLAVIQRLRSPLRARWPALAFTDHLGVDTTLRFPQTQALLAGLVCAVVGGTLSFLLIRSADTGQVVGSLLTAFVLGGLAGQLIFPQTNPVGILLSPALVALVGYGWVLLGYGDAKQVLAAWHGQSLPGLALALPIHYASAGVAGCALGVGWAQGLAHSTSEAAQAAPPEPGPRGRTGTRA